LSKGLWTERMIGAPASEPSPHSHLSAAASALTLLLLLAGFPRSCARVLAALYVAGRPLTSREIAEVTGYSKSMVSAATQMLVSQNVVRRLKRGRHDAYAINVDLSQLLLEKHVSVVESTIEKIRNLKCKVNSSLRQRLEYIEGELLYMVSRLRGGRHDRR